jgi:hypothetical protein
LRVSLLGLAGRGLEPEDPLQGVLLKVDLLDRVLRADWRYVQLEKWLGAGPALWMVPSGGHLIVHEIICLLLGWEHFLFFRTLRSLRNAFCILQEFLVLFLECYSVCKNINSILAFVVYFVILLLSFIF